MTSTRPCGIRIRFGDLDGPPARQTCASPPPPPAAPPVVARPTAAPRRPGKAAPALEAIEKAVAGCLMDAGDAPLPPALAQLLRHAPGSFENLTLGQIVATVRALRDAATPVHELSVLEALGAEHPGCLLLGELPDLALGQAAAELEAAKLLEAYRHRRALTAFREAAQALEADPASTTHVLDAAREVLTDLAGEAAPGTADRTPQPIGAITRTPRGAEDPDELIKDRFLCRGGGLLLAAPTGVGKSTYSLQGALCFAVERECLGLVPARPLRSLYVQAENDDGDLAELRDGIVTGLGFSDEERRRAFQAVHIVTISDLCGREFLVRGLGPLLVPDRWDLLWIDPLLSYIGGDVSRQEVVSPWLRNGLNPMLRRARCGSVVVHHTNKPPSGREKPNWAAGDFAYLGSGSADLANWARAVIAIRSVGSHEVFELRLAKRGKRVGWKDGNGAPCYTRFIAHGTDGIYWRDAEAQEAPGKVGRPEAASMEEVVALLGNAELASTEWQKLAKEEHGVSERSFYRLKRSAAAAGAVSKSKLSGKWFATR